MVLFPPQKGHSAPRIPEKTNEHIHQLCRWMCSFIQYTKIGASGRPLAPTWQREKDSNPHIQRQSLLCYPYTIPLFFCRPAGSPRRRRDLLYQNFRRCQPPFLNFPPFFSRLPSGYKLPLTNGRPAGTIVTITTPWGVWNRIKAMMGKKTASPLSESRRLVRAGVRGCCG